MGKYSNINTKALLNTLNTALNEIDQYNLNLIWNNFKKRTILDSQVNNNIDLVFSNYYDLFLLDSSKFESIFNKYEASDLADKISKNVEIIEFL